MLLFCLKETLYGFSFAVFTKAFKRILFLIGYQYKVSVILYGILDRLIVGYSSYLIAPFFDREELAGFLLG